MSEFTVVEAGDKPVKYVPVRIDDIACMRDWQMAWVEKLAEAATCRHFLEIGVYRGQTTRCLAQHGDVVAVDWFLGSEELYSPGGFSPVIQSTIAKQEKAGWFKRRAKEEGVADKITVLCGKSDDVLPLLELNEFGIVLVDGNHLEDYAYRDIKNTWKLIVPGGWLLLDDFSTADAHIGRGPHVRRAWEKFAKENGLEGLQLYTCDKGQDETHAQYGPKLVGIRKP